MNCLINVQNFNFKYKKFRATQKRVDLGKYIMNLQISTDFVFLCSLQYKKIILKFHMLVGYVIYYVYIYFQIFLKQKCMIFEFF
jgi:hypothetical protein